MGNMPEELQVAIEAVEQEYNADVYFYSGPIDDRGFGKLVSQVTVAKSQGIERPVGLLILTTNGGQANAAYNIARFFQKMYSDFVLYTPSYCKSAGTLIALGANCLVMDAFSELGPLDVQLFKQNEIMTRKSGLLTRSSFESLQEVAFEVYEHFMLRIMTSSDGLITFQVASELSAEMTTKLLAPVYGQIDPDIVGSDYRDVRVAIEYGRRLAEVSGNAGIETVYDLVNGYPSHDFIIDDDEAKNLFKYVDMPKEALYQLIRQLGDAAYGEQRPGVIVSLSGHSREEADDNDDTGAASHEHETESSATGPMDHGRDVDRPSDPEPIREGDPGNEAGEPADVPEDPDADGSNAQHDDGTADKSGTLKII